MSQEIVAEDSASVKIQLKNVHKSFGTHKVLDGVTLDVIRGESLVILGGSGTGKSVMIRCIIGLIAPDAGEIYVDGSPVLNLDKQSRLAIMQKCGFLFQSGALFDSMTTLDNITFFAKRINNLNRTQQRELAVEKLRSVGLKPAIADLYPSELSGGMQKRVALARAICTNPEIVFFDEPTTGLDPIASNVINDLIIKIKDELKITCVTITHDMNSTQKIADRVAMLANGQISWHGPKNELYTTQDPYIHQFVRGETNGPIQMV